MILSNSLVSEFVKVTNDETDSSKESTNYGTIITYDGVEYVKLDGSDLLTPVRVTTQVADGERVTVLIKNHAAIVTGNITTPSASTNTTDKLNIAINQQNSSITQINSSIVQLNSSLELVNTAVSSHGDTITSMNNNIISINNTVNQQNNIIESMNNTVSSYNSKFESYDSEIRNQNATINNQNTTINNLNSTVQTHDSTIGVFNSSFQVTDGVVTGIKGVDTEWIKVNDLEVDHAIVNTLDAKYATIDFANIDFAKIDKATFGEFYAESGLIKDVTIGDATITGELVGVTIRGDRLIGGTVIADKLVIKGEDGLFYKLNTDGVTVEAEQTSENSLNGEVIIAKSITASKIDVKDLIAFGATIGGFKISTNAIHSVSKTAVNNTTRGIYLDNDGQSAIGDETNFVKFYKDADGQYKLDISASNITFGKSKTSIDETVQDSYLEYALSDKTDTAPTSGWKQVAPQWTEGKYMWQRKVTVRFSGETEYGDPTCISGAQGQKGEDGQNGQNGTNGRGISSTKVEYQASSNGTTAPTGTWSTTVPTLSAGQYMWTRTTITYTDSTTSTSYSIGKAGTNGTNGSAGKGIKTTVIDYQASSNGTTAPTGTWVTTIPSVSAGQYLWTRTTITYTDNATSTLYSVGMMGAKGATGTTGTGIDSVSEQYYVSTSKTAQSGGSWSDSMPTWTNGKYLWIRTKVVYKNPASTAYTTPYCDSSWEVVTKLDNDILAWCYNNDKTYINGGKIYANSITTRQLATDAIKSVNYVKNSKGSYLNLADGSFDSKYLKWTSTGVLTATSGTIGGFTIEDHKLSNNSLSTEIYFENGYTTEGGRYEYLDTKLDFYGLTFGGNMRSRQIEYSATGIHFGDAWIEYNGASLQIASQDTGIDLLGNVAVDGALTAENLPISNTLGVDDPNMDCAHLSDYPCFIGSLLEKNATWYNVISVRHRNGLSDGNQYGMFIRTPMTTSGSLVWNQQIGSAWGADRTILDSANVGSYALPINGGTVNGSIITNGSGETNIGPNFKGGRLYMFGNNSSGSRGIYDSSLGYYVFEYKSDANQYTHYGHYFKNPQSGYVNMSTVGGGASLRCNNDEYIVYLESDCWRPQSSNSGVLQLGTSTSKWKQVFASTSSISTSDRNLKKDFTEFDERYENLFLDLKPQLFRLTYGESNRFHSGFVSQDVEESLINNGLTSLDFAGFCKDKKQVVTEITEDNGEKFEDVLDEDGNNVYEYSLRYEEFIALNTHMIQKLIGQVKDLQQQLAELKGDSK